MKEIKNVFANMKLEDEVNEKPQVVKKDFNYFIEAKRPKKELLEWFRRQAKKLDIDPDDLNPTEDSEDEE